MRTFSCFITEAGSHTPRLSLIFAETEQRALQLARRELLQAREPLVLELRENSRLVWVEAIARPVH